MNLKLLSFAFFIFLVACQSQAPKEEKEESNGLPNIVLLIGDDQGYPYFGFMGADYVYTPNMDSLAASGTLFTDGYVPDNHCRPSLQTLMTGTLPIDYNLKVTELLIQEMSKMLFESLEAQKEFEKEFRFHAMKRFVTLPKLLSEIGYVSFQGGKWWEFNYQNGGFDEGMTKGWAKEDENKEDWFQKFMGGDGTELARATMEPVYEFIENYQEQPFFIWFAPELPHYPFDAPDKYYNLYKDQEMSESAKRYYANCTWFDDGVGALIQFLKEKEEFENTLFVYVNDNGWEQEPMQEFRHDSLRWHNGGDKGKLSMYDQSFRTPIIFSWKDKIESGKRIDELIHSADIPATILDFVNINVPKGYFGQSYKAIIEGKQGDSRKEILGNITQTRWEGDMMGRKLDGYWMRTKDWFFNWNATDSVYSLYDMNKDPRNNIDLAEAHPEKVMEFKAKIIEWKEQFE